MAYCPWKMEPKYAVFEPNFFHVAGVFRITRAFDY